MSRIIRKFVAVVLAVWLPFFSGNALAVSVVMQSMHGKCHSTTVQESVDQTSCASGMQHARHDAERKLTIAHHDQQDAAGENCATCHLACCGYMAAVTIEVMNTQLPAALFTPYSSRFQSVTTPPLDPPPLTRT